MMHRVFRKPWNFCTFLTKGRRSAKNTLLSWSRPEIKTNLLVWVYTSMGSLFSSFYLELTATQCNGPCPFASKTFFTPKFIVPHWRSDIPNINKNKSPTGEPAATAYWRSFLRTCAILYVDGNTGVGKRFPRLSGKHHSSEGTKCIYSCTHLSEPVRVCAKVVLFHFQFLFHKILDCRHESRRYVGAVDRRKVSDDFLRWHVVLRRSTSFLWRREGCQAA